MDVELDSPLYLLHGHLLVVQADCLEAAGDCAL